jgi:hypothetical protein
MINPFDPAFIGDQPPGPLAFNDDDAAILIDFSIACGVHLQKLAHVAGSNLHDLILIVDVAELIVELEEKFLTALGLVHFLPDLLPLLDVLKHADETYGLVTLIDDAAAHMNMADAPVSLQDAVLDVEIRLGAERIRDRLVDALDVGRMEHGLQVGIGQLRVRPEPKIGLEGGCARELAGLRIPLPGTEAADVERHSQLQVARA